MKGIELDGRRTQPVARPPIAIAMAQRRRRNKRAMRGWRNAAVGRIV
jgi:hypothetical protein